MSKTLQEHFQELRVERAKPITESIQFFEGLVKRHWVDPQIAVRSQRIIKQLKAEREETKNAYAGY